MHMAALSLSQHLMPSYLCAEHKSTQQIAFTGAAVAVTKHCQTDELQSQQQNQASFNAAMRKCAQREHLGCEWIDTSRLCAKECLQRVSCDVHCEFWQLCVHLLQHRFCRCRAVHRQQVILIQIITKGLQLDLPRTPACSADAVTMLWPAGHEILDMRQSNMLASQQPHFARS